MVHNLKHRGALPDLGRVCDVHGSSRSKVNYPKKKKNAINQMHTLWVVYIQLGDLYDCRSFQITMEFPLPTKKQAAFPIKPFILSILLYRENATFTGSFLSQSALTLYLPRTLSY
jgi:hypothetical protein